MTSRTACPGPESASSTIAFSGRALPPRICSSAVITITAPVSAMRSRRLVRGEAAEHDRVGRADAGAGLHRDHALDRHRHVDHDAVALDQAARLERIGQPAGALEQLAVGHPGDAAVVGLEDERHLVAEAGLDVPVEAVVRGVQGAVVEPVEERRLARVEHVLERRAPAEQLARQPRPVGLVVALGLVAQRAVGRHARHVGILHRAVPAARRRGLRRSLNCLRGRDARVLPHKRPLQSAAFPARDCDVETDEFRRRRARCGRCPISSS